MIDNFGKYFIDLHKGRGACLGGDIHIRIDDRHDHFTKRTFCNIYVRIAPDFRVALAVYSAPDTPEIIRLVETHGGTITAGDPKIDLPVAATDAPLLRELAEAFRRAIVIVPGQPRYKDITWMSKCPRAARTFEEFAQVLDDFCRSQAQVAEGKQS